MNRTIARAAAALAFTASLSGCSFLQKQGFAPPTVSVADPRIAGVRMQGGKIDIVMSIYNPNNYRLDAEAFHYKVLVDSTVLGEGTIENRVTLPQKDSAEVRVPVVFGWHQVLETTKKLAERGTLPFQLI